MNCRLCEKNTQALDEKILLGKHRVRYFHCPHCDLIQTEAPYWLEEAYSDAVSALDVGALNRNLKVVNIVEFLARFFGNSVFKNCLDYGGGIGTLVRMLRDRGLNFRWYDAHSKNIYAKGFEGTIDRKNDVITSFEVFEHFADVKKELEALFKHAPQLLLVETLLHWGYQKDWWYLSLETGQHISFYSQKTMQFIAAQFNYHVVYGHQYTLFISKEVKLSSWAFLLLKKAVSRPYLMEYLGFLLHAFFSLPSLSANDIATLQRSPLKTL